MKDDKYIPAWISGAFEWNWGKFITSIYADILNSEIVVTRSSDSCAVVLNQQNDWSVRWYYDK
jgi:hypothetical protein